MYHVQFLDVDTPFIANIAREDQTSVGLPLEVTCVSSPSVRCPPTVFSSHLL